LLLQVTTLQHYGTFYWNTYWNMFRIESFPLWNCNISESKNSKIRRFVWLCCNAQFIGRNISCEQWIIALKPMKILKLCHLMMKKHGNSKEFALKKQAKSFCVDQQLLQNDIYLQAGISNMFWWCQPIAYACSVGCCECNRYSFSHDHKNGFSSFTCFVSCFRWSYWSYQDWLTGVAMQQLKNSYC